MQGIKRLGHRMLQSGEDAQCFLMIEAMRKEIQKCGIDLLYNLKMGYFLNGSTVLQTILARLDYLLVQLA